MRSWLRRFLPRDKWAEHYRLLAESPHKESLWYQAQLYPAWRVIGQQGKGLLRQERRIKRRKAQLAEQARMVA